MSDPTDFTSGLDSSSDAQQRAADLSAKTLTRIRDEVRRRMGPNLAAADPIPPEYIAVIESLEPFVDEFAHAIAGVQILRGLLNAGHLEFFPVGTIEGFRNLAYDAIKLTTYSDPGERNAAANRAADLARQLLQTEESTETAAIHRESRLRQDLERGMAETEEVRQAEDAIAQVAARDRADQAAGIPLTGTPEREEYDRAALEAPDPLVLFDVYPATINQHELADAIADLEPSYTSFSTSASEAELAFNDAVAFCQVAPAAGWVIVRTWRDQAPHVAGVVGVDGIVDTPDELEPAIAAADEAFSDAVHGAGGPIDITKAPTGDELTPLETAGGTTGWTDEALARLGAASAVAVNTFEVFAYEGHGPTEGVPHYQNEQLARALAYCEGAPGTRWDVWEVEPGRQSRRLAAEVGADGTVEIHGAQS